MRDNHFYAILNEELKLDNKKMNIIIFGPPGAGKGTQAKLIAENSDLHHLSSGELSRQMQKDKQMGEKIKHWLEKGQLIPNSIIINIVKKYIINNQDEKGFIFDGYPRNLGQAKELDKFAKKNKTKIDLVINLKLSEEEALKRILKRGKISGRSDDNLKTTKNRLHIYKTRTEPILDYYRKRKILKEVDGKRTIKQIEKEIKKIISQETKKTD